MHPKSEFIDPSGCMETVRAWLSESPSRGFERETLVFTKRLIPYTSPKGINYEIYLHRGEFFMSETMDSNTRVAAMLNIPKAFSKITTGFPKEGNRTKYIGRICYVPHGGCAFTSDVYPKDSLPAHEKAKRFGTFAELVCTHDLQKSGVKSISSTDDPHWSRIKQLSDCRLSIDEETPIMDWKRGLSLRLRKFHSEARKPSKAASASSLKLRVLA